MCLSVQAEVLTIIVIVNKKKPSYLSITRLNHYTKLASQIKLGWLEVKVVAWIMLEG
jgi:hypothetical protein